MTTSRNSRFQVDAWFVVIACTLLYPTRVLSQNLWVIDTTWGWSQDTDAGLFSSFSLFPNGAPWGSDAFMWENPHTLIYHDPLAPSSMGQWTIVGTAMWGEEVSSEGSFYLSSSDQGVPSESLLFPAMENASFTDTLRATSRGACACGEDIVVVGDLTSSDTTRSAFALKWGLWSSNVPFMYDLSFSEGGVDTLTFLGPDQSFEACAAYGAQLAMVGWGLDSCCVHKEVPIVRVVDGESGASWTGFGNSGTIALELPSGMINDSIGGLPIHETGGWFEDVAWSPDGQVLFAAGAALNGNVFQPLLAKFHIDGTLDEPFADGGLSLPLLSPSQNHWITSLAVLENGDVVALMKAGTGEDIEGTSLWLLHWNPLGEWQVDVLPWEDVFTPGHLEARGNEVAIVGTIGDDISIFGERQIGVATWSPDSSWTGVGSSSSQYLLSGSDIAWVGDSALHVSARYNSPTIPAVEAPWDDGSSFGIYRFSRQNLPTAIEELTVLTPSSQVKPSPTNEMTQWAIERPADRVVLRNIMGNMVWDEMINGEEEEVLLRTSFLPNGVYIATASYEGKVVAQTRFIVGH